MWKKKRETEVEGCGVLRIRPQQMLIRVDLGTRSMRLMDRVQGQTSPRGAMILSLIVHTPPSYWPYPWALALLSSPRITGRINLCLTEREREGNSVKAWRGKEDGGETERKTHRGPEKPIARWGVINHTSQLYFFSRDVVSLSRGDGRPQDGDWEEGGGELRNRAKYGDQSSGERADESSLQWVFSPVGHEGKFVPRASAITLFFLSCRSTQNLPM